MALRLGAVLLALLAASDAKKQRPSARRNEPTRDYQDDFEDRPDAYDATSDDDLDNMYATPAQDEDDEPDLDSLYLNDDDDDDPSNKWLPDTFQNNQYQYGDGRSNFVEVRAGWLVLVFMGLWTVGWTYCYCWCCRRCCRCCRSVLGGGPIDNRPTWKR